MKNSIIFFLKILLCVFILGAVFTACEKEDNPATNPLPAPDPGPGEVKGVVRPVGTPVGNLFTKEIGPAGGEVATADGNIKVKIPAGALLESVAIGVQEIENTNHAGIGKSFRLTPHGQQFEKEVEIIISYEEQENKIVSPQALGVSFQDDKGIWNFVANSVVDEENKVVTVRSNHFSDWTIMHWMYILPFEANIEAGESIELKAVRFVPVSVDENDLLTPLVPPSGWVPVGEHVDLEEKYIGKWSLAGPGVLVSSGSTATYKAPDIALGMGTVAVSLQLSSEEEQLILISNITVSGGGIEFRINGGEWIVLEGAAVRLENNRYSVASVTYGAQFTLGWHGGIGSHSYNEESGTSTVFQYWPAGLTVAYTSFYETPDDHDKESGGAITITSMGDEDGWVTGTFTVNPSGIYPATGKMTGTASIEGKFRVRRSW